MTDERCDFEACQMLTDNAENLSSAISKALYHTQSASIRVTKETRKELGLIFTTSIKEKGELMHFLL